MHRFAISSRTWLVCILTYACVGLLLDGWSISRAERRTDPAVSGSLGAQWVAAGSGNGLRIAALAADSPLLAAGAQPGDLVSLDLRTDLNRYLAKSDLVGLTLTHAGSARHLRLRASSASAEHESVDAFAFNWAGNIIAALCGILLAVRRSDPGPQRVLAILLVTLGYGTEHHILPQPFHELYFRFVFPFIFLTGWFSFPYFALVFPAQAPLIRHRWVRRLFVLLAVSGIASMLLTLANREALLPPAFDCVGLLGAWSDANTKLCVLSGFAALLVSWRGSRGQDRRTLRWITLSLGLCYLSWIVDRINKELGNLLPPDSLYNGLALARSVATIALAYALMSRRLFDFGFVLNRALVVAVISSALLVVFAVTEFAVDKLLHFHGRETNVVIDAAVALGVILSFHRIQHWVDHQVNHFFFHQWHEAAEALRGFMRSATHISDAGALQEKFVAALGRFADTAGVASYLRTPAGDFAAAHRSGAGTPSLLDANQDLIIAIRHRREAVAFGDGLAFPMMLRGALSGIVLVQGKRSGQAYRPDEAALMQKAAQQLALDLESLRVLAIEQELAAARHAERSQRDLCEAFERVLRERLATPAPAARREATP